ncbi:hypothetical protein [uncultured Arcticibacterium sp.]|uniref:hypothetical protein n=1 Tax=uncultured Arcticibacterium sp. TaxID=2173042 RepID=UPI0030FC1E3E
MSIQFDLISPSITNLVSEFIRLRQSQKKEELESTDWKTLEKAYYNHLKWRFEYPKKVFSQQITTGIVISLVVLILIISGLAFSFWQLHYALTVGDFSSLTTEASIETAGKASINSSIIGAVVLVISLAFFYLYLKNVFQIQYPTPPHVGFGETDLKEGIKSKLFGSKGNSNSEKNRDKVYEKIILEKYLKALSQELYKNEIIDN